MLQIQVCYIVGLAAGVEYQEDEYFDYLIVDLLLLRLVFAKEKKEE